MANKCISTLQYFIFPNSKQKKNAFSIHVLKVARLFVCSLPSRSKPSKLSTGDMFIFYVFHFCPCPDREADHWNLKQMSMKLQE